MSDWVFHDWVGELPWKMQSVLMTATRGPDEHRYANIKIVNRWIRSVVFRDADPRNPFIANNDPLPNDPEVMDALEHELEYVSVHYFGHLIHALEIIGYEHPDRLGILSTAGQAMVLYAELCERILHLPCESPQGLRKRLGRTDRG